MYFCITGCYCKLLLNHDKEKCKQYIIAMYMRPFMCLSMCGTKLNAYNQCPNATIDNCDC